MDAIVGRDGLLNPILSGTYNVNAKRLKGKCARGEHASNLGAIIASDIASSIGKYDYIVDIQ